MSRLYFSENDRYVYVIWKPSVPEKLSWTRVEIFEIEVYNEYWLCDTILDS